MGGYLASGDPDLLALALSRPNDALARARAVLADGAGAAEASIAHQAIGIVLREFGDIDAAVRELRTAHGLARRSGCADREADVLATLGVALVFAGRTRSGRAALNGAVRRSTGLLRGRTLLRRGGCLRILGHRREALADLNGAVTALRAAGDDIWEARALNQRAGIHLSSGTPARAASDLARAGELFAGAGQDLEVADVVMLRGLVALRVGDLPAALALFDQATDRYAELGLPADADLSAHRCEAFTAAGLAADALRAADATIGELAAARGQPAKRAELLLVAANCALAAGDTRTAGDRAAEAARMFGRQGRSWWRAHAQLARVRASADEGPATMGLLRQARRVVRELTVLGSPELPLARLAAGRAALALAAEPPDHAAPRSAARLRGEADEYLAIVAAGRRHGPALARATAWLAQALRAQAAGDGRALMIACRRGLAVIDDFTGMFGSSELRARSTAHGAELAALGLRHAGQLDRPRLMLEWSERWRAVALAVPAVRPPDDEALCADLAALRSVTARLAKAAAAQQPSGSLELERQRLERAVRTRSLRTAGERVRPGSGPGAGTPGGRGPRSSLPLAELLDELGRDRLIELVDVDQQLHALVCGAGRVRKYLVGPTADSVRGVRFARQALRRVAHGPSVSPDKAAVHDWLTALGGKLDRVLLGEAGDHLGDGTVVIVPPGSLQAVPWGLLPRLTSRAVSVAPSAVSWLRARRADPAGEGPVREGIVLIRGPGLASGGAEVPLLAADYSADARDGRGPAPVVLGGGTATAGRVLAAIDGAGLVHIAAHGTFRADSPLFSALRLDDGPLTVYDLERLRRGPRRLVLSSCDSGVAAPTGADEMLGLANSLLPLGTTGIVASVVPVNDAAAVPLMTALHRGLRCGRALPEALTDARQDPGSDPVAEATGWSFICLGA